jgi:cellulose synthase (UDP-forming)
VLDGTSPIYDAPEQAPTGANLPEPLLPSAPPRPAAQAVPAALREAVPAEAQGASQASVQAAPQVAPQVAPHAAPHAPARASNDWVGMMLDYENERALAGRAGRGAGTA